MRYSSCFLSVFSAAGIQCILCSKPRMGQGFDEQQCTTVAWLGLQVAAAVNATAFGSHCCHLHQTSVTMRSEHTARGENMGRARSSIVRQGMLKFSQSKTVPCLPCPRTGTLSPVWEETFEFEFDWPRDWRPQKVTEVDTREARSSWELRHGRPSATSTAWTVKPFS